MAMDVDLQQVSTARQIWATLYLANWAQYVEAVLNHVCCILFMTPWTENSTLRDAIPYL